MTTGEQRHPDPAPDAAGRLGAAGTGGRASRTAERALGAVGRWLLTAGRATGRAAARAYRSVDPDVRRHLAQLPLLSYTLLSSREQAVEPGPDDGWPPLLLVHGLGGGRGDFWLMAQYLALHGHRRSYRIHFDGEQTVEQLAAALARFAGEVLAVTGEPAVDVVAHSLGGLVTRLALSEHGLCDRVRTVITLGTPHGGTFPARYAGTKATRQLRPDSPLIERLQREAWPAGVRGVTFWSRSDMLVLPPESAALAGTSQVEVTPFTHYSYLLDPRSWVMVRRELERG